MSFFAPVIPEPPPSRFDYSTLDVTMAETIRSTAERIKARMRESIIETGRDLLRVKAMFPGAFGAWLDAEFGWTDRTARNYMNAARLADGKSEIVSVLPPGALYRLAAPSTPDTVRDSIIARLHNGESISDRHISMEVTSARNEAAVQHRAQLQNLKRRKGSRERREAAREAREIEWQKQAEEEKQAALQAINLLRDRLDGDLFKQFAEFVERSSWCFVRMLREELVKDLGGQS